MDKAIILEKLNSSLNEAGVWLESTKEFAFEQAPLVIKEILYWGFTVEVFELIISLSVLFTGLYWVGYLKRGGVYEKYERNDDWMFSIAGAWITLATGVVVTVLNVLDPIKVVIAPRLYLIEYFRTLLQSTN